MKAEIKGKDLIITIPMLEEKQLSGSKKSFVIATSGGNQVTTLKIEGKPVTIGLNAYIKNEDFGK